MRVVILGAGGHAKVVADILQRLGGYEILGFLDDDPNTWNNEPLGLPVLGGLDQYTSLKPQGVVVGVGSNKARQRLVEQMGPDAPWINAIHPAAVVAPSVRLGAGVVVAAQAVINPDARIGQHAIINTAASVDHDSVIGDYGHIAPGAHLAGGVTIGAGVLVGVGVSIVPGRRVGDWAVIGAGSTVIHDIPAGVTVKGTPARE